jgi:hypothetical protein
MDWGTFISGAIIIAICVVPIALLTRSGKKRKKQLLQTLHSLAEKRRGKISQNDFWADSAIGLDEQANFLYFIRGGNGQDQIQEIDLANIRECKAVHSSRTADKKHGNYKVVEQLELCLSPSEKGTPDISLEFYHHGTDLQINWDVQLLDKWAGVVNDRLKKTVPAV